MEERTLELTIVSAQGLKKVSTFGQETCYAVAYIDSTYKRATNVDRDGGVNPNWNVQLTLTCDDKLLKRVGSYITVEIYSYGMFSNKLEGTSRISLIDVGKQAAGESRSMALEVRRPSGKVKGVLNVSVRVGETRTVNQNRRNHSGQALAAYPPAVPNMRPQRESSAPLGYAETVYPPPKRSGYFNATTTTGTGSKKQEEPVMAYPVYPPQQYGYGQQYGPQSYGTQYAAGPQQFYYPAAQDPYGYQQQVQYSTALRPRSKWQGSSSGAGLGLLGGALGGLLLGDVIGHMF